ncbi:response regulator transcription factor [Roseiterribacter gracilis]|uniref:DNA-binding response regulator n=1 Tax=Roseiterribacter gracilis TaxID=2812848 RepID=A0A8S8XFS7_9PROT|nr:DNA-binding response regulator [Rhodospirillales bacterium TMPK1]
MSVRFLLAEHLPVDRAMIRARLLELFDPGAIDEAFSLDDAVAYAGRSYDLVMIDPELPGMDFAGGLKRLQAAFAETPIALIAGVARAAQVRASLQLGVRGFFPKTLSPPAFAAAIRLLLAGGSYVPMAADAAERGAADAGADWLGMLEQGEYQLLALVARGLTNKEIARRLVWEETQVQSGLAVLFRKAGARTRSELAAQAALAGVV